MTDPRSFDDELAGATDRLSLLVRRLRSLSPRAWERDRIAARAAVAELVAMSERLEGRNLERPDVPDHVLPDVIALIGGALLATAGSDARLVHEIRTVIDGALGATR